MTHYEKWKEEMKSNGVALARLHLATNCSECPASNHCKCDDTTIHCIEAFLNWANKKVEE